MTPGSLVNHPRFPIIMTLTAWLVDSAATGIYVCTLCLKILWPLAAVWGKTLYTRGQT